MIGPPDCNIRVSRSTSCNEVAVFIASRILAISAGDAVGSMKQIVFERSILVI